VAICPVCFKGFWKVVIFTFNKFLCTRQKFESGSKSTGQWPQLDGTLEKCLKAIYGLKGQNLIWDRLVETDGIRQNQRNSTSEDSGVWIIEFC